MLHREALAWLSTHWKQCVLRPSADAVVYRRGAGPSVPGLYLLWHDDSLVYVGLSVDVCQRLAAHQRARRIPFSAFSVVELPVDVLPFVEAAYIDALAPPFNQKAEPSCWPGHAAMVRRLRRAWAYALS